DFFMWPISDKRKSRFTTRTLTRSLSIDHHSLPRFACGRNSIRACRIEYDLIVLPELPDESASLFVTHRSRGTSQDLIDGVFAVDRGEHAFLRSSDGESEIRIGVRPIDQHSHGTGRNPVSNAHSPRQTQRNVTPPRVTFKRDRRALTK